MFSVDCKLLSLWTDSSFSYDQLPVMLISHYDSFLNFYRLYSHQGLVKSAGISGCLLARDPVEKRRPLLSGWLSSVSRVAINTQME